MPSTDIKRPDYYEGQYLGAQDLVAAQEYQRQQDQRHRLAAHTWGIAMGLELEERPKPGGGGAVDVFIKPGYAVDGFGRSIVVLEPYKIPETLFTGFVFDASRPEGEWVPIWLRYREEKTNPPRPGFTVCDVEAQAYRVLETFRIIVGELPESQQRDQISVAGKMADAKHPDKAPPEGLPDASVPYQAFPDYGTKDRWLIPLGNVRWLAPGGASPTGHFVQSVTDDEKAKVVDGPQYIGVVAASVLVPAGKVRIKDRRKVSITANETSHLAAIEGSLRIDENAGIRGKLGIGNLNPQASLHVAGDIALDPKTSSATPLTLPTKGTMIWNDGTWLRLNQNLDFSKPIFGVHTPGLFAPGSLNVGGGSGWGDPGLGNAWITGSLGVGTTAPDRSLTIQGSVGTYLNVKANGGIHEVLLGADGNGGIVSTMTNHDLQLRAGMNVTRMTIQAGGNVGIGTATPSRKLEIIGDLQITGGNIFVGTTQIPIHVPVDVVVGIRIPGTPMKGGGGGSDTLTVTSRLPTVSSATLMVALGDISNFSTAINARWKIAAGPVALFSNGANFTVNWQVDDDGEIHSYQYVAVFLP